MTNGAVTIQDVGPALDRCRREIAEFKRLRLVTEAAMNGIIPCKVPPEQLAAIVQRSRDPLKERMAAEQHREFLRMLYKREPTAEELRAGPPALPELERKLVEEGVIPAGEPGMGNPLLAAMGTSWILPAAAVVGGAWGLSMLFAAMAGAETTAHREGGIISGFAREAGQWTRAVRTWALPAVLAVGVGGLGYWYLKGRKPARAAVAALPARSEMKRNVEPEDEDEGEDDAEVEPEDEQAEAEE